MEACLNNLKKIQPNDFPRCLLSMSHKYFLVFHHQLKETTVLAVTVLGITLGHVTLMNNKLCSLY